MDKGDAGLYKFPRRNRSEISLRNQNPSSGDNRIQQPPWKLGISGGGSGSSAGASHHKPQKSHSPEKPGSSTLDTTKNVRRSSSRPLGTRPFKEKHKQKRSYVAESSSSSTGTDTGKSATQVLAEAGDMPDFVDSSVWSRGIGSSSSSSSRFLSQRNKQINLGSTCNGTGTGTGTGMHRRGGTKSFGCTSAPAVVPSGTEGVKKRFNGEGSSSVARQLTGMAAGGSNVHVTTRGVSVSQVESRISRVIARNNETDLWALRADWVLASSQEDQREEEAEKDDLDEDEDEDEDEEDYEDEAQPSRFAFLLPHQLYASSSQSRLDSGSGFGSLGLMSNSTSDSASSISSRMAPWRGAEESGRTSHRTMQHGLRLRDREVYQRDGIAEVLLALERIEQHGEMSYAEQMMILETNFLLNGLTFRDEHRDMRMDIDSMSYEELLALEEKMGTVSTALSEEEVANCLKRNTYHESISHSIDDVKCCICQEEYEDGEEIGMLKCEHWYHVGCIREWLSQKNWCPVCKTSQNDR